MGMKCIQYYYGIPTGTIAFWGNHVPHILTVEYTFKFMFDSTNGGFVKHAMLTHMIIIVQYHKLCLIM